MNTQALSAHVLYTLALAQMEGRLANLETLTEALRVRRGDIRRCVSQLDREGYLDALHMRLTLAGFAIGRSLSPEALPMLRRPTLAVVAA